MRKLLLAVKRFIAWRVLCRAYARWVEADGSEGAAAFAYYLLLSFLPLVILMVTAATLFVERDLATQAVVQWVKHYVPLTVYRHTPPWDPLAAYWLRGARLA